MNKISIRFYNDREVRAIWSEDDCRWFYSATDVVRAINNENDYVKAGNYWRWLKKKLAAQGVQPVSDTHEFNSICIQLLFQPSPVVSRLDIVIFLVNRTDDVNRRKPPLGIYLIPNSPDLAVVEETD